jgi:hypothetical protein
MKKIEDERWDKKGKVNGRCYKDVKEELKDDDGGGWKME